MLQSIYKTLCLALFIGTVALSATPTNYTRADIFSNQPQVIVGGQSTAQETPSKEPRGIGVFIAKFFQIILGIIGLCSVAFLLWGAVKYINSLGMELALQEGKTIMLNSIIAIILTILVFALVRILTGPLFT